MKRNFKVIKGNKKNPQDSKKIFSKAFITNTRLMGAMGMAVFWKLENADSREDNLFFQYFYFQTDGKGIESYDEIWNDTEKVEEITGSLMASLGGDNVDLTEKEVLYLIQFYDRERTVHGHDPIKNRQGYVFALTQDAKLSDDEKELLQKKLIPHIKNTYELCHYFFMRLFDKDLGGIALISDKTFSPRNLKAFQSFVPSTLCRNEIIQKENDILCESLIESHNKYRIIKSRVFVKDNMVYDVKLADSINVSSMEVAMIMSKPEFISLYEIDENCPLDLSSGFNIPHAIMKYEHPTGILYMVFKENNNYVKQKVFSVNNDILGVYFVTYFGQVIVASPGTTSNAYISSYLSKIKASEYMMLIKRFHFKEAVIFDFIQSEMTDFEEFVSMISQEDPD